MTVPKSMIIDSTDDAPSRNRQQARDGPLTLVEQRRGSVVARREMLYSPRERIPETESC